MSQTKNEHIPLGRHCPEAGRTVSVTSTSPMVAADYTLGPPAPARKRHIDGP
ncbi:MAG: hypothetical protein M0026_00965 [Nocardiopsaceae bacterium]|nr:hypothetical protein [Nocardiopsaceae bacterium]